MSVAPNFPLKEEEPGDSIRMADSFNSIGSEARRNGVNSLTTITATACGMQVRFPLQLISAADGPDSGFSLRGRYWTTAVGADPVHI